MFRFLLLLMIILTAPTAAAERIRVFVSIPPQKQFVEKVGGDQVDVRVMLPPGESPETYSPTPKMMAALSGAKLYFEIGVPFERSWIKSVRSLHKDIRIIACCDQILGGETPGEGHHDPHIWGDPILVRRHARDIMDALAILDPERRGIYAANYRDFAAELDDLDRDIKQMLALRRTDYFVVSHAAWGHYAKRYGLKELALEKSGKEAGPRSLQNIIELSRREQLGILFVVGQYKNPFLDTLAAELGARILELDPLAEDYLRNLRAVTDRIAGSIH